MFNWPFKRHNVYQFGIIGLDGYLNWQIYFFDYVCPNFVCKNSSSLLIFAIRFSFLQKQSSQTEWKGQSVPHNRNVDLICFMTAEGIKYLHLCIYILELLL